MDRIVFFWHFAEVSAVRNFGRSQKSTHFHIINICRHGVPTRDDALIFKILNVYSLLESLLVTDTGLSHIMEAATSRAESIPQKILHHHKPLLSGAFLMCCLSLFPQSVPL